MSLLFPSPGKLVLPDACRQPIQFPVAPYIYLGARRMAGYRGPCYDVQPTGGGTARAIGFDAMNHVADWRAAATYVGGPTGLISKFYDQSANAFSPTQATAANMPVFNIENRYYGMLPCTFDGNNLTDDVSIPASYKGLTFPAVSLGSRATTLFWVVKSKNNGDGGQLSSFQNSSAQGVFNYYWPGVFTAGMTLEAYNGISDVNYDYWVLRSNQVTVLGLNAGASNVVGYVDGTTSNFTVYPTGQTATQGFIGGDVSGSFAGTFDLLSFVAFNSTLSVADMASVARALAQGYNSKTTYDCAIVYDGDSRMAGFGTFWNQGLVDVISPLVGRSPAIYNMAVSGQKAQDCQANYTANVHPILSAYSGVKRVYVAEQGINDAASGTSASTIYNTYIKPTLASARTDGAKTVCCTIMHEVGDSGTEGTIVNALNVLIKAGAGTDFDVLCDMDAVYPSGIPTPTLSLDGTHATVAGNEPLKALLAGAIARALMT